ncbi:MAG: (2Fe-2S) ferredoxin domain-containing protein [Blastocatellia bacterium]|nr:(2Fe-2S) ferredoxin domain-containing protein [Blastocatellia bacterium]
MSITTKRRTLAHLLVCLGCCCGRTDRGKPEVPADWLKAKWKEKKLHSSIHLSISGCLGPCDLANVAGLVTPLQSLWLGGLTERKQYELLVDWASDSATLGMLLPLPEELQPHIFERFLQAECDECSKSSTLVSLAAS